MAFFLAPLSWRRAVCRNLFSLAPLYTIRMPRLLQLDLCEELGSVQDTAEQMIAVIQAQPSLREFQMSVGNAAPRAFSTVKAWLRTTGRRLRFEEWEWQ